MFIVDYRSSPEVVGRRSEDIADSTFNGFSILKGHNEKIIVSHMRNIIFAIF